MSYNYSTYVASLQSLLVATDTNGAANLNAMLPNIIDYAEQRIFRELDLLTTLTSLTSTMSTTNRNLAVPAGAIVVQSVNVITPALTAPDNGTRNPLRRTSVERINFAWPVASSTNTVGQSIPTDYAIQNNNASFGSTASNYTLLVAPPPDQQYVCEFVCTVRPTPLSATNTATFLTTYLPDLFLAASMVFASGYQRDFGQQSSDPMMAVSWESQYQLLKASANTEEMRKKAQGPEWQAFSAAPEADAPR